VRLTVSETLEPGLPVLGEAVLAIDGPAIRGLEGNFTFFTAVRTSCLVHFSRAAEAAPRSAPKSAVSHCNYSCRLNLQYDKHEHNIKTYVSYRGPKKPKYPRNRRRRAPGKTGQQRTGRGQALPSTGIAGRSAPHATIIILARAPVGTGMSATGAWPPVSCAVGGFIAQ
jgi:hypothetical protein